MLVQISNRYYSPSGQIIQQEEFGMSREISLLTHALYACNNNGSAVKRTATTESSFSTVVNIFRTTTRILVKEYYKRDNLSVNKRTQRGDVSYDTRVKLR